MADDLGPDLDEERCGLVGAWGVGAFDNDDAADFVGELAGLPEPDRVAAVRQALLAATEEDDYLEIDAGSCAVAGAALVAANCPNGAALKDEYGADRVLPLPVGDLRPVAGRALARVLATDSELQVLWGESEYAQSWRQHIEALRRVLTEP